MVTLTPLEAQIESLPLLPLNVGPDVAENQWLEAPL
jgi:hypothetical protein